jgi:DNA-binding response OmpR family regulator
MIKLLLIEDNEDLGFMLKNSLEDFIGGYEVRWVVNGKEGLDMLAGFNPDIIVSDIEMPVLDGIEMVKLIRQTDTRIPIILASARTYSKSVTIGFEAGINNYIKKPFLPEELDAHIKALLAMTQTQPDKKNETVYILGAYKFDPQRYCLEYQSQKKNLSQLESNILTLLCENMGDLVERNVFFTKFWNNNYDTNFNSRSLDVFVNNLRHYLEKDSSVKIRTVKKVGLILEVS